MRFYLFLFASLVVPESGAESCQNYQTIIKPWKFREGEWIDQVRIYSGNHDYVSHRHPNDTVSMFLAKYKTNCGFFELKILSDDAFELFKGYYVPRFREHFYPFKVQINKTENQLRCNVFLEQRECEYYGNLKRTVRDINILHTDYSTFMIIHQCIDSRNYIMLLTKQTRFLAREKVRTENLLIDVIKRRGIVIDNGTFWWPTTDLCDMHIGNIFPIFYNKIYFDRKQSICPENLTVSLARLSDYWKNKTIEAEQRRELRMTIAKNTFMLIVGILVVLGLVWLILDNCKN